MEKYCRYCGASMEEADLFCTKCGKPAETTAQPVEDTVNSFEETPEQEVQEVQQTQETQQQFTQEGTWEKDVQTEMSHTQDDAPLSFGTYMLLFLVMMIPIVNIVVLLLWAFGHQVNTNKKNFSRAALVYMAIGIVLSIVVILVMTYSAMQYMHYMQYYDMPYEMYQNYYYPPHGCSRVMFR